MEDTTTQTVKKSPQKMIVMILAAIVLVAAIGSAVTFYLMYDKANRELVTLKQNPQSATEKEAKEIIEKVGKLVDLPTDETPQVATVSNLERLKEQPFFAKAKIGDKVLIYPINKKAILYDPVANKVLEIGPIADNGTGSVAGATASGSGTPRPIATETPVPFPTEVPVVPVEPSPTLAPVP
jgi:hypothetical protein